MTFKDGCAYFDELKDFPTLSIVNIHGAELHKINGEFICTEDSKFDQEIPYKFFDELLKTNQKVNIHNQDFHIDNEDLYF